MDKQQELNYLAIELLERLGNSRPAQNQIDLVEDILSSVATALYIDFDRLLTSREIACLFWAAPGYMSNETAKFLGIRNPMIEVDCKSVRRKLSCDSMAQAVYEGINDDHRSASF